MSDEISIQFTRFSAFYSPLIATIAYYQKLGCWTPHVEITRPAFEATLDIFQHAGQITKRHAYDHVVAAPPAA